MQTLLTVPITIREQIYHELLTYIPSETATKDVAPSSPICKLLTLNRQINTEVLKFLSSQLCVVVKTNYSRFSNSILDEQVYRLPLISQLQSRSGAIKKDCSRFPVAMEWDSCVFRSRLLAESTPYCLMPATSMMQLTQIATKRSASLVDTSLTFTLLETFSYSKDRALEILVGPWLEDPSLRQRFLAINTNDAIPPLLAADLREHWQRQGSAGYYLLKIDMFMRNVNSDTPENTVIQYKMVCKYARLVYDCQLDCIRSNYGGFLSPSTEDTVLMLWSATCTTAADLVEVLCHLAGTFGPKGLEVADASDSVALLQEARKVAEEMISFLSDKPFCAQEESMTSDAVQIPVRKQKFLMSFKAHIVCKALGDVDAAIGYLEDATKYYSESPENPVEKLHELRAERGTGNEGSVPRVVRWTS